MDLVANTAKYVGDLPIIGVNPDPARNDGVLLPFKVSEARKAVRRAIDNKIGTREVTLAEVNTNDGQRMLAFNDFFIGASSHVSARYTLETAGRSEPQSSSGVLVSTGAGSTGWLSSLFNMTDGLGRAFGSPTANRLQLDWEDRRLVWAVREPFRSRHSGAESGSRSTGSRRGTGDRFADAVPRRHFLGRRGERLPGIRQRHDRALQRLVTARPTGRPVTSGRRTTSTVLLLWVVTLPKA